MPEMKLPVRYNREITDLGVDCREENLTMGEMRLRLPVEETGLVLVDCWDEHPLISHLERTRQIAEGIILPALQACRRAGIRVFHAPSPPVARRYPQWLAGAGDQELSPAAPHTPDWPPPEFVERKGLCAAFARPAEPVRGEWLRTREPQRRILSFLGPEPGDYVIATGEQLHRLCRHHRLVHLIYAGFAANICVQYRDYGVREMGRRGYNVVLMRDGTTAIETAATLPERRLTEAAILDIELRVGFSTSAVELMTALAAVA